MTIERYNYNDEPSGRSETLIQALEKIERLETQLEIAKAVIYSVLHDKFINENADAGLVMYITGAYQKIKELEKWLVFLVTQ